MKQKKRMLAGKPYHPGKSPVLQKERGRTLELLAALEDTDSRQPERRCALLKELLGGTGERLTIERGFYCDYGGNITVGEDFYANAYLTILDPAPVTIGKNVMIAPHVGIYTATHPLHADDRNSGYEYALPIVIGDDVWIGGHVVINPGVTIGRGTVIGAGSVVTRDLPERVVAVGNPCRVVRAITEEDRGTYRGGLAYDLYDE